MARNSNRSPESFVGSASARLQGLSLNAHEIARLEAVEHGDGGVLGQERRAALTCKSATIPRFRCLKACLRTDTSQHGQGGEEEP